VTALEHAILNQRLDGRSYDGMAGNDHVDETGATAQVVDISPLCAIAYGHWQRRWSRWQRAGGKPLAAGQRLVPGLIQTRYSTHRR
jgi:hypothetical protein